MGPAHEVFMSPFTSVAQLVRWSPLQPGEPAPKLSLTADEGTWIRLPDFKGHINVLLVFFRSMSDDATDAWLKDIQRNRQRFEDLETAVFGVSTARTDKLREYRSSLGLEFFLLYDPLAVDSRAFRCSGRLRPVIKDNVVLVGKDGLVVEAWLGRLSSWPVYTSPHRLEPFVARIAPGPFRPAADEVAAVVAVPLRDWLDAPAIAGIPWVHEGRTHMSPVFELGPHLLFGATAHAFLELLHVAAAARGQPLPPWDPHRYTWEQLLIRR
jgi:peroxiredoxin